MIIKEHETFIKHKTWLARKVFILRILYYLLNLSTIFSTLLIGIITTVFLAGTSTFYPEGIENPYRTFLNENGNYVVLVYILNSLVTLISGILSFFVINSRYINSKRTYKKLKLEYLLYLSEEHHYDGLSQNDKNYRLYRRTMQILGYEKYSTEEIMSKS